MLSKLRTSSLPLQHVVRCQRPVKAGTRSLWSSPDQSSTQGPDQEAWRIRIYDFAQRRAYAIDFGHFDGRWFLGPSTSVALSRSDESAGRPNSFKHFPKQLAISTSPHTADLSAVKATAAAADGSIFLKQSDSSFGVTARVTGASLTANINNQVGGQQVSQITQLANKDMSDLYIQTVR